MELSKALNTRQAAELLGRTQQTLAEWRWHSKGPAYFVMGGRIHYKAEDLQTYMDAHRVDPEAQAATANSRKTRRRNRRAA